MIDECKYKVGDFHLGKRLISIHPSSLGWHWGVDEDENFHGLVDLIFYPAPYHGHMTFGFRNDLTGILDGRDHVS